MSASSKTASTLSVTSADLAALVKAITALTEQTAANNKLVAALLSKGTALPSAESVPTVAPTKGGRGKKAKAEKEPKVKPAPPSAEEGVIRFGPASEGEYKEFSVFFKAPFTLGDKSYASLANYFHSAKFEGTDDSFAEDIRTQKNPALTRAKASKAGQAPRPDWDTAKLSVMRDGLLAKFRANSALKRKLLSTDEALLESTQEEEMRVKGFWSIGEDGTGANHMGKLLMEVRDTLRADGPIEDEEEAEVAPAPSKKAPKAPAKSAPKAAAKPAAKPAADSDSDSDEEDEEAPGKPAPKPATKPATKPAPKPAAKPASVPKKSAPAEEEGSDSDSDSEDDE